MILAIPMENLSHLFYGKLPHVYDKIGFVSASLTRLCQIIPRGSYVLRSENLILVYSSKFEFVS